MSMQLIYYLRSNLPKSRWNENEFNLRAGFTKKDDQLPEMFKEAFPPHNTTWTFTEEELQAAKTFK